MRFLLSFMDYKEELKKAYNEYAKEFDEKFQRRFQDFIRPEADAFLEHLSGKKILDLGSGAGNHGKYLQDKGFDVLCVDISEEMVNLCREKGLRAEMIDMESLRLPEKSFDGVWAYTSLIHTPKKDVPKVVQQIFRVLKPGGILGLALKEGIGEGPESDERYPGAERWFSYFTSNEAKQLFGNLSELISESKTDEGYRHEFMNFLFRARA